MTDKEFFICAIKGEFPKKNPNLFFMLIIHKYISVRENQEHQILVNIYKPFKAGTSLYKIGNPVWIQKKSWAL